MAAVSHICNRDVLERARLVAGLVRRSLNKCILVDPHHSVDILQLNNQGHILHKFVCFHRNSKPKRIQRFRNILRGAIG